KLTFIGIIGNTQGVSNAANPPINPVKNMVNQVMSLMVGSSADFSFNSVCCVGKLEEPSFEVSSTTLVVSVSLLNVFVSEAATSLLFTAQEPCKENSKSSAGGKI